MVANVSDAKLARRLATEAGDLLTKLRESSSRTDAAQLRALGDRAAHEFLAAELESARPNDVVLSEEAAENPARLSADRVWIVDPLDGTREFGEGRDDWAVHVALWSKGELVAGAIALPGLSRTLATDAPPSCPPAVEQPRIAVSRTRAPQIADAAAEVLGAELVPLGSAGFKVAATVLGDVDAYVHAGGQYEWDSAAPVAVARAAGLHVSRLDGSAPLYNQPDPYLPDLLVCRPELAAALLSVCAPASEVTR